MSTVTAGSDPDPFSKRPEGGFPDYSASEGRFPAGEGSLPSSHFGFPPGEGDVPSFHFILSSGEGGLPPTHFAFPPNVGGVPSTRFTFPSGEGSLPSSHFRLPSGASRFKRHPSEPAEAACPLSASAGIFPDDRGIPKTNSIALYTE